MKRAFFSLAFGFLFPPLLLVLSSVGEVIGSIGFGLLSIPAYVLFARKWFGIDCANADSIADKVHCAWMLIGADVILYAAICYVFAWLISRRKRQPVSAAEGVYGKTLDI